MMSILSRRHRPERLHAPLRVRYLDVDGERYVSLTDMQRTLDAMGLMRSGSGFEVLAPLETGHSGEQVTLGGDEPTPGAARDDGPRLAS